jgi:hypothetical protein
LAAWAAKGWPVGDHGVVVFVVAVLWTRFGDLELVVVALNRFVLVTVGWQG